MYYGELVLEHSQKVWIFKCSKGFESKDGKINNEFAQEGYFYTHAGKELGDGFSDAKYVMMH